MKKILLTPLDWGLGHATRCIPIADMLLKKGVEVVFASSGDAAKVLQRQYPSLKMYTLTAYEPAYPSSGSMVLKIGMQLGHFIGVINKEQEHLEKIVAAERVSAVISDNRYGAYSKKVKSVFVTHQTNILMPPAWKWIEGAVNYFNRRQINRFAECWLPAPPDNPFPQLIQERNGINTRHIGYLNRLQKKETPLKYEVAVICSGPEPQRTLFEDLVTRQLSAINIKAIVVRGKPAEEKKFNRQQNNITVVNYLDSDEMSEVLNESGLIICRSGYTMVMELAALGKKAVFVPTPGQTEQEYLAATLMDSQTAFAAQQNNFNLEKALKESEKYWGFQTFGQPRDLLEGAVNSLL